MAYEGMIAESLSINGDNNELISAYVARPLGPGPFPGVVLIHHLPGWSEWYREATRRFAHHGYAAISHNLYHRSGEGSAEDVAAKVRAEGGVADAQVIGDTEGAVAWLRAQPYHNGKVGVIGSCSGGRQAFLYACNTNSIDAVIDLWGGRVVQAEDDRPDKAAGPADRIHQGPFVPPARSVRKRRPRAEPGTSGLARSRAQKTRQGLRVSPL